MCKPHKWCRIEAPLMRFYIWSERIAPPEENARREKIRKLLQMENVGSMDDIQNLFKETIVEFMENGLEAEVDDELGYSKCDYKNKDTDSSCNGHSRKMLRTSLGDAKVFILRDRKSEFETQVLKKNQTSISQNIENKILLEILRPIFKIFTAFPSQTARSAV